VGYPFRLRNGAIALAVTAGRLEGRRPNQPIVRQCARRSDILSRRWYRSPCRLRHSHRALPRTICSCRVGGGRVLFSDTTGPPALSWEPSCRVGQFSNRMAESLGRTATSTSRTSNTQGVAHATSTLYRRGWEPSSSSGDSVSSGAQCAGSGDRRARCSGRPAAIPVDACARGDVVLPSCAGPSRRHVRLRAMVHVRAGALRQRVVRCNTRSNPTARGSLVVGRRLESCRRTQPLERRTEQHCQTGHLARSLERQSRVPTKRSRWSRRGDLVGAHSERRHHSVGGE
jgi:hypothetical protein